MFTRGDFDKYKALTNLNESVRRTRYFSIENMSHNKTSVFTSHKHDDLDLEELKGVIGMLEQDYNVVPYIDSMDNKMPNYTCAETAKRLKQVIKACDKFILLATNNSVESYWCNWEVGIGDVHKYKDNIAVLPMQDKGKLYKGNEYLKLYPSIEYFDGTGCYSDGRPIRKGYYVRTPLAERYRITSLQEWLNKK